MKKLSTILIIMMILMIGSVSLVYAQDNGNTNEGNTNEGNTNEGNTNEGNTNEGGYKGLYGMGLKIGLRGAIEVSVLNYVLAGSGNHKVECLPVWGDLGVNVYYEMMENMYVGGDIFYSFDWLLSIHAGYLQDFIDGPVTVALNATIGYDMFIDKDADIAHGFGVQLLFIGGYDVMDWLEVGGDVGVNFAMVLPTINGENAKVLFVNIPIRLYVKVKL